MDTVLVEAPSELVADSAATAANPVAFLRALLVSEGAVACDPVLSPETCAGLVEDVRRAASGPVVRTPGGGVHAVALLGHSQAALALLDHDAFGALVAAAIGDDVLLSRADGVLAGEPRWMRGFEAPLRDLPSRAFRPGITAWIALSGDSTVELVRSSHNLPPGADPEHLTLPRRTFEVARGAVLLLEAGAVYRLTEPGSTWFSLEFVRPWLKPQLLFADALGEARTARLGARGRGWCGQYVGLPQSVEEFLAIEEAALTSTTGQSKGSGI